MPDLVAVTQADVDAGRILLRAPLSAFLTCRRIPNGSWDSGRKAWSFPATQEQARRVQSAINRLATTPRFDELVAPAALPEPAPAPAAAVPAALSAAPATEAPEGLLTRPWRHQSAAFLFCLLSATRRCWQTMHI